MKKLSVKEVSDHNKSKRFWKAMEFPELSLAPTNGSECEGSVRRKRKSHSDDNVLESCEFSLTQTSTVDLHQLKETLLLDWEQCLDLESGRMYYINRKTLRKSWDRPKDQQKLDLELNVSTCSDHYQYCTNDSQTLQKSSIKEQQYSPSSSNMVALPCLNCHLLVILSTSSPSCPNCKFLHSLPPHQMSPPPPKVRTSVKSLDTLSLLK
ncbi:Transcription elongation regulator like [Actinidia chinensis var. chinensis]|uniref:Transcription elongation regulator like n=1 Tax=Actinidia chinensis var. chinensis TaxID=1590841 RepID=A0A2R6S090_ACTCC|nr:Transcription elongation regulator like [Actinidia chinensis var. chinensis]